MIGRVYRGGDVGGLLRYLYGPGRHNEHENPHLVAAWDLTSPLELASLEPPVLSGEGARAVRDFGPLTGSLELATSLRHVPESVVRRMVWHCPLRVTPGDRELTDAEWGEVARHVLHTTGIARHGDDGGCRWIAVRHDAVSVHLVAVLARQDGTAARVSHDHLKVRQACREAEQQLRLTPTAPADRTAATHVSRAEVEKSRRTRGPDAVPDRLWLRERVQLVALKSADPEQFLRALAQEGVHVRVRRGPDGRITGYAVARPPTGPRGQRDGGGTGASLIFYGGGKLAPDLSLPQLERRWTDRPRGARVTSARSTGPTAAQAARVVETATREITTAAGSADPAGRDRASALVGEAAGLLSAVAAVLEPDGQGELTRAARRFDRASREPHGRALPAAGRSQILGDVAYALQRSGRLAGADLPVLLGQLVALVDAVRQLRAVQQRQAQAVAAAHAVRPLQAAAQQRQEHGDRFAVVAALRAFPNLRAPARVSPAVATAADHRHPSPAPNRSHDAIRQR